MVQLTLVSILPVTDNLSTHEALHELVRYLRRGREFHKEVQEGKIVLGNLSTEGSTLFIDGESNEMAVLVSIAQAYGEGDWEAIHAAHSALGPGERGAEGGVLSYALIALITGLGIEEPAQIAGLLHRFTGDELVRLAQIAVETRKPFLELTRQFDPEEDGDALARLMRLDSRWLDLFMERCRTHTSLSPKDLIKLYGLD